VDTVVFASFAVTANGWAPGVRAIAREPAYHVGSSRRPRLAELKDAILDYLDRHDAEPKSFVWPRREEECGFGVDKRCCKKIAGFANKAKACSDRSP
jgi:hypothetical protein